MRPVIRPATRDDLIAFYGEPLKQTVIANVGVVKGKIVGCGGAALVDGRVIVFCDFKPLARRYKISIVKAAWEVIKRLRDDGVRTMWADIDPKIDGAERWVRSLGFLPTEVPRLFRWVA